MISPSESSAIDLLAVKAVDQYIKENPECKYKNVAQSISWYWEDPNFSPWVCDYIVNELIHRDKYASL